MSKKRLYMVQPTFIYNNALYVPYASGCLVAYAFKDAQVARDYSFERIVFTREPLESAAKSFETPFVAAFSNYVWNFEYNKALARRLKELYPDCVILFGGHNIPKNTKLLDELPYIDFLIYGEGEETFRGFLSELSGGRDFASVNGLAYRLPDGSAVMNPADLPTGFDFPSPYLEGIFDSMIEEHPEYYFSAILETNRGCPHQCAYCDWGLLKSKVRLFPMERVIGEIEWFSKKKLEYCYGADANFGMFERDEEIVDRIIAMKKETGFLEKFRVNFAKNSDERVFRINKKLSDAGMSKGVTLSFQSLSPDVLENIGRRNMSLERFSELLMMYNKESIPAYSELIFGMPGETAESFAESIDVLFAAGQHSSLFIYNCELLVNSRMGEDDYVKKHRIKTTQVPFFQDHALPEDEEVAERSNIIISTDTMDTPTWITTRIYSLFVHAFHCMGFLQFFAIYCYFEKGIKYSAFYDMLLKYIEAHPEMWCNRVIANLREKLDDFVAGKGAWVYVDERFGEIAWPLDEGLFLDFAYDHEAVYRELRPFLDSFGLESELFEELFAYQKLMVKLPGNSHETITSAYDFSTYFSGILSNKYRSLEKRKNTAHIDFSRMPESYRDYAKEVVWFGRRNSKMMYDVTDIRYEDDQ